MNKNMKLALLIMATGLVLAGCAGLNQKLDGLITTKWDKAAKETAVVYFDEDFAIYKIDGKENVNMYGQAAPIRGSGTKKEPKAQRVIPAGERTLVIGYKQEGPLNLGKAFNDNRYEFTYIFVKGRYYQLTAGPNGQVRNPKFIDLETRTNAFNDELNKPGRQATTADTAKALEFRNEVIKLQTTEEEHATNVEIIDITGGKKKNSPSIIVTIKPWEQNLKK